jgi:hypothetical protein
MVTFVGIELALRGVKPRLPIFQRKPHFINFILQAFRKICAGTLTSDTVSIRILPVRPLVLPFTCIFDTFIQSFPAKADLLTKMVNSASPRGDIK